MLTNAHNVRGSQVTVTFADGRTAEGNVAGHDIDGDLAVIEADTGQAAALPWATTAAPAIGTQTEVHGELRRNLPVVLDEDGVYHVSFRRVPLISIDPVLG